jgi:HAD superfamily hydrolase (TIGR01484 family)
MTYKAYLFDIDKTLTASKEPIESAVAEPLAELSQLAPLVLVSGDSFAVIEKNVLSRLPETTRRESLYVLPTSGAALYHFQNGAWQAIYALDLDAAAVSEIDTAIAEACTETGLVDLSAPSYGDIVEHRGPQVTISALGQDAPIALKDAWDSDGTKKRTLRDAVAKRLPLFDVKTGGATSVDVTQHGVNKAYGVREFGKLINANPADMLYVGDALYEGGNDEVVKETGIATKQVSGPDETKQVIADLLGEAK